jgi:uncharacterized protein
VKLYLDASALVKRYVEEEGSDVIDVAIEEAETCFMCRVGFVETARVVDRVAGRAGAAAFRRDWGAIEVIEVDAALAEAAAELSVTNELRSLDALHLAAMLLLTADGVVCATWDRRLHLAAQAHDLRVLPEALPA